MTIKIDVEIEVPTLPNFLKVVGQKDSSIPISACSEEELRAIGAQWTEDLVKAAKRKKQ